MLSLSGFSSSLRLAKDLAEDVVSVVVILESLSFEVGVGSIWLLGASADCFSYVKHVVDGPVTMVMDDSSCGLASIVGRGCWETAT